jgi:hypothetical protein
MTEISGNPGISPAMRRILAALVFVAGLCFALTGIGGLAKAVSRVIARVRTSGD